MRELFGHAVQRGGEVADLARRRERRPPREIAGRDRACDVAQLDDGLRDAAREEERQRERAEQREQAAREHVALRAAHDLVEAARRERHAHVAERMLLRDVELVVARRRAVAARTAHATGPCIS